MLNASRYNAFWLVLFTVGSVAACSSAGDDGGDGNNNNNTSGTAHGGSAGSLNTGGTPGKGGSGTSGSATAGSGTSGSATAGSSAGGAAGAGGGAGFACAGTKPPGALITEFMDLTPNAMNAGQFTFTAGIAGGTFAYQKMVFTLTDATKALNIKGNVKDYDGFGVYLGACMDATAFDGVSFNIKGNAGPTGKLSFRFQNNANMPIDAAGKKGTCAVVPAGSDPYLSCHNATYDITVTPGGSVVSVKFTDVTGGLPNATITGKDIVGLEWAFPWAGATDTAYDIDVTVDDIKFTGGSAGGAGGSGGGGAGGGGNGGTGGV